MGKQQIIEAVEQMMQGKRCNLDCQYLWIRYSKFHGPYYYCEKYREALEWVQGRVFAPLECELTEG